MVSYRGELDKAFFWLERAYAQRDVNLLYVRVSPLQANARKDPRMKIFLKKLKLDGNGIGDPAP